MKVTFNLHIIHYHFLNSKKIKLRFYLFPLNIIFRLIIAVRNYFFDNQIMKSNEFDVPIIAVGNLTTGGTGKTPHVEYLIRLLKNDFKTSTLSRGYGRKTFGFIQANEETTAREIGDEPYQIYHKYKKDIDVFVEAKRIMGVINIMSVKPQTDVILMDDAFQHRAIAPGFSVLLTDYNHPYYKDFILPVGNLREPINGRKRADVIIVTKCPKDLGENEKEEIIKKLKPFAHQNVYFTGIRYGSVKSFNESFPPINLKDLSTKKVVLITGIAKPDTLLKMLNKHNVDFKHLKYPDHHHFSKKNISNIIDIFGENQKQEKIILTTEKDAVRLKNYKELSHLPVYYVEIEVEFLKDKELFDNQIINYVKQDKGNS